MLAYFIPSDLAILNFFAALRITGFVDIGHRPEIQ
jgi:hypothetical protein